MNQSELLDADSIIEVAEIGSGVTGLIDEPLKNRVEALLRFFRSVPCSFDRAAALRRQIVQLLARRLSMLGDIARHPDIREEKIEAPIFIVGFARTGTTLLQCLMGADPAHRVVSAWQVREPSPPPGEMPIAIHRIRSAASDVERYLLRCEGVLALHPYWDALADTPTEDEEIMTLDFHYAYPSLLYEAAALGPLEPAADPEPAYRFLKEFMQYQQWRQPKKRWVMKGVLHQGQLAPLLKVFPDAKCVWAHREPAEFVPSTLAIVATTTVGITLGALDRKTLGRGFMEGFKAQVRSLLADPAIEDPRVLHMAFHQLAADPIAAIRSAYDSWGLTLSSEAEAAMRGWLADPANRNDRYRRHTYDFAPFGVDWAKESPAFDDYRARFLGGSRGH